MVICCVYELTKQQRQCLKGNNQLGRYESSPPSTKELHDQIIMVEQVRESYHFTLDFSGDEGFSRSQLTPANRMLVFNVATVFQPHQALGLVSSQVQAGDEGPRPPKSPLGYQNCQQAGKYFFLYFEVLLIRHKIFVDECHGDTDDTTATKILHQKTQTLLKISANVAFYQFSFGLFKHIYSIVLHLT